MKIPHATRLIAALVVLASMLFSQLALAAYVCPSWKIDVQAASQGQMHEGMSGCAGMDKKQPNLCHAHAQMGKQSLDKPDLPSVQPFVAAALVAHLSSVESASKGGNAPADLPLPQATAPPHSILHCCFRI